jgi:hypothetical protein
MGDYPRARKIYCFSALACIHTLEPAATGRHGTFGPEPMKSLPTMFPKSRRESAKILKHATLKVYKGFPHGMPTTNADQINADLLAFFKGAATASA